MLRFTAFGGLALTRDGVPHAGPASQRRRLTLLALLASAGTRGVSRDRLLALLWPDREPEQARNALNQALHAIRTSLGTDELFVGVGTLRLNGQCLTSDVADFDEALAGHLYERAVGLYTGPFADGLSLDGSPELERWLESERGRRAREHAAALESLATAATARRDLTVAVYWWRRLVAAEPLSARAAAGLIETLVAVGDRSAALQFATVHATLVRQELDSVPDPAIATWIARLRAGTAHEPSAPSGPAVRPSAPLGEDPVTDARAHAAAFVAKALGTRYDIGAVVTDGPIVTTFEARDRTATRPVMLHVIQPRAAVFARVRHFLATFERVASLSDPHITPVYDFGAEAEMLYFVSAPPEGLWLKQRLRRERELPINDVVQLARDVSRALAHAHSRGICHGDLRPKYIALAPHRATVTWFGLVDALTGGESSSDNSTVLTVGSPAYLSPEQLTRQGHPDARSDVYSFGCVVHEMLVGAPPFGSSEQLGTIARKLTQPPPSVRATRPSVSATLERILATCLAFSPADRFRSGAELAAAFETLDESTTRVAGRGPA